jgi:hypothetical protein
MDVADWLRYYWQRVAAVVAVLLGALALLLGWLGVSRSSLATQQIPYLVSGGIFGLFALGIGATLWLSADLHEEWLKLDDLYQAIRGNQEQVASRPDEFDMSTAEVAVPADPEAFVPAPMTRRNRPLRAKAETGRAER